MFVAGYFLHFLVPLQSTGTGCFHFSSLHVLSILQVQFLFDISTVFSFVNSALSFLFFASDLVLYVFF